MAKGMIRGRLQLRRRLRTTGQGWSAQLRTWFRWHGFRRGRPHGLPGRLVVSLTSYPPRFGNLGYVLRTLLSQSVVPDEVVLWIAHADAPRLPADIQCLRDKGLSIRFTDDLKSFKKIIPMIEACPEAFIATADDDIYYHSTWLEELATAWAGDPREIVFHRGHTITLGEDGRPRPYRQWRFQKIEEAVSRLSFPTGVGGVLYPPGSLDAQVTDRGAFLELCPNADDVWLYWMGRRAGSRYRHAGGRRRNWDSWPGSQHQSLHSTNRRENQNDAQIHRMIERFGFPPEHRESSRRPMTLHEHCPFAEQAQLLKNDPLPACCQATAPRVQRRADTPRRLCGAPPLGSTLRLTTEG